MRFWFEHRHCKHFTASQKMVPVFQSGLCTQGTSLFKQH